MIKLSKSTNTESERKGNIQRGNAQSPVRAGIVLRSWDPNTKSEPGIQRNPEEYE